MFQNLFTKAALTVNSFLLAGDTPDFLKTVEPIVKFIDSLKGPALTVVIALAAIYCIILGAKFAKAEEPQEREKAKAALKNAIIGFVLIFVLLVLLNGVSSQMAKWAGVTIETSKAAAAAS